MPQKPEKAQKHLNMLIVMEQFGNALLDFGRQA